MELINYNQTLYQVDNLKNINILHIFIATIIYIMIVILSIITVIITRKTNKNTIIEEKLNNLEVKLIEIENRFVLIDKNVNTILRVTKELKKLS